MRASRALVPAMLGILLAACFGGGGGTPSSTPASVPSVTSSPAVSSTATATPPVVPPEASVGTRAGAEAFFRYFWAVYNYSYASLDTSAVSPNLCPVVQVLQPCGRRH